jgi:ABC-type multidrug transport system ATPase subunit
MSILTGLFPPSSGDMSVNGLSIRHDMPTIRAQLGLCPQYNVLFDWLTVDEHLFFCATLRGIPAADIKASASKLLDTLNLTEKQFVQAGSLSGGMKRKLCVVREGFSSSFFLFAQIYCVLFVLRLWHLLGHRKRLCWTSRQLEWTPQRGG